MIDIDEQRKIDGVVRKTRVGFGALNDFDVRQVLGSCLVLNDLKHRRLEIVGVHLSGRTDEPGEARGHVAGARPDVCDNHSRLNPNELQRLLGRFLLLARRAIEPVRVGRDAGNLPPRERVSRRRRPRRDEMRAGIEGRKAQQARHDDEAKSPSAAAAPCSCGHVPSRAIGDHRDLHVPRKIHDPLHQRRGEPRAQRSRLLTRDEDLRDAMNPREIHHRFGDVGSLKDPGLDLQAAGEVEVTFQALAFTRRSGLENPASWSRTRRSSRPGGSRPRAAHGGSTPHWTDPVR